MEITGTASSPACGRPKKGIKKSVISGALDIGTDCESDVPTALAGYSGWNADDDHLWFLVGTFCDYLPANHPTGTMSVVTTGAPAACSIHGTITDSGQRTAVHRFNLPPSEKPYTYWGIDSGMTMEEHTALCNLQGVKVTYIYSGDSRFRGFP